VIVLYLTGNITGVAAIILGILALVSILTSLISFCPLYVPFKIATISKKLRKLIADIKTGFIPYWQIIRGLNRRPFLFLFPCRLTHVCPFRV
jgi:hypothetical protein